VAGRPSKWEEIKYRLNDVTLFARLGMLDDQIAAALGISPATFYNLQKKHHEFVEAIKRGKNHSDNNVRMALYKRACGYEVEEKTYQARIDPKSMAREMVLTETKVKHIAPDVGACALWLFNRCPEEFSRNPQRQLLDENKFEHQKKMDELKEF